MAPVTREDLLNGMDHENRLVFMAVTASLVFHLIFFFILIFTQTHDFRRRPVLSAISVDLVSMPAPAAAPQPAKASKPAEAPPVKAEPKPSPESDTVQATPKQKPADVSLSPKKKVSLKKKTFKTEKVKQSALKKLEEKVETTSSERIAEAIDKIKSMVEDEAVEVQTPPKSEAGAEEASGRVPAGEQETGSRRAEIVDIYRVEIAYQIQKNWAFPDQLAGGRKDLQTLIIFKVMPNGEIQDLIFTDRSGNKHFDESAYRAVMKSNPVDPHPEGISEPFIQMGLRFTPEGIK